MPSARIRAAVLAALVVPAVLALTAAPASAHNELLSSNPADRATLTALPPAIELKFGESTDPRFVKIAATGPDGKSLAAGAPQVSGATIRQPLTAGASGKYTVAFRVVSKDGHPVQGKITFTATLSAPTASPSASAWAAPASAENADEETRTVAATEDSGRGWAFYAIVGAVLLGLIGFTVVAARSRSAKPEND